MVRDFLSRPVWELGSSVRTGGTEEKGEGESFPEMEVRGMPLVGVGEREAGDIISGEGSRWGEIDAEGWDLGGSSSRSPQFPSSPVPSLP